MIVTYADGTTFAVMTVASSDVGGVVSAHLNRAGKTENFSLLTVERILL